MTRDDVVAYAQTLDGLGADPADPDRRAQYLDLIAPAESPAHRDHMATMSGCELVQRGILRRFIAHPRLEAKYVDGHAGEDLWAIAREAGAAHTAKTPEPGDILLIGGGADGGGPEHAYMALEVADSADEEGALHVKSIDGGQRDEGGAQVIATREHVLCGGWDRGVDASDPGGGSRRKLRLVLDLDAILAKFGRPDV